MIIKIDNRENDLIPLIEIRLQAYGLNNNDSSSSLSTSMLSTTKASKNNKNDCLVNIVKTYEAILVTLGNYNSVKSELIQKDSQIEQLMSELDMLYDIDKLKKYLAELIAPSVLGTINVDNIVAINIKPEYLLYHQVYGIPDNYIYDFAKLKLIKESLNII